MKEKEKEKVFAHYGWKDAKVEPLERHRCLVKAGDDVYILHIGEKKDPYFAGGVYFRRYLEETGADFLPSLLPGRDDAPLFKSGSRYYAVERRLPVKPFSFQKKDLLINAMKTFAPFHRLSEGFEARHDGISQSHLGQWPARLERNLKEGEHYLEKIRDKAADPGLLSLLKRMEPELKRRGERGLLSLCLSPYEELAERAFLSRRLSYGAVNHRGLGYYKSRVLLTDFHRLNHDLAAADLWQLFRRYLSYRGGKPEEVETALRVYEGLQPLYTGERMVLGALLHFPYYPFKLVKRLAKAKGREEAAAIGKELYGVLVVEEERSDFYRDFLRREERKLRGHAETGEKDEKKEEI